MLSLCFLHFLYWLWNFHSLHFVIKILVQFIELCISRVKFKKTPSLFTLEKHVGGGEFSLLQALTWARDGGEWSVSNSYHFTPGKTASGAHSMEVDQTSKPVRTLEKWKMCCHSQIASCPACSLGNVKNITLLAPVFAFWSYLCIEYINILSNLIFLIWIYDFEFWVQGNWSRVLPMATVRNCKYICWW